MLPIFLAACEAPREPSDRPDVPEPTATVVVPPTTPLPSTPEPRPVMGGGLILDEEGRAWITDPDSGRLLRLDPADGTVLADVDLGAASVPNRLAITPAHVAIVLRGPGAVAIVDRADLGRVDVPVCNEPRGITTFDHATVWVACADGVLAELDLPSATIITRLVTAELDLRDVLPDGDLLAVTRMKSAELLTVDPATGAVLERRRPPTVDESNFHVSRELSPFSPFAAWRTVPHPDGGFVMVHLRGSDALIDIGETGDTPEPSESPYGGGSGGRDGECGQGIVHGAATVFHADGSVETSAPIEGVGVPVDVAIDHNGTVVIATLAAEGERGIVGNLSPRSAFSNSTDCALVHNQEGGPGKPHGEGVTVDPTTGGVVYSHRFPLGVDGFPIEGDVPPVGADVFHRSTPAGLSCASCHPEGHEDGRAWRFRGDGFRRTQELGGGGLSATAPFHWDAELATLDSLMTEVHDRRMGGEHLDAEGVAQLARFLDSIPALRAPAVTDEALVAEGEALFLDPAVGCAGCHTDPPPQASFQVGTSNGPLQVPRLHGLAYRAPFIHDGCAPTLRDRFDPACGGDAHGDLTGLDDRDLDALTAWLATR